MLEPEFLVLDEPTASLDMSVRARILETLDELRRDLQLGLLLVSHDIATVRRVTDRLLVMYRGQIVEGGATEDIVNRPFHPYTRALMDSALHPDPSRPPGDFRLVGEMPSQSDLPSGCYLAGRCPVEVPACVESPVDLEERDGRLVRCIRASELIGQSSSVDKALREGQDEGGCHHLE